MEVFSYRYRRCRVVLSEFDSRSWPILSYSILANPLSLSFSLLLPAITFRFFSLVGDDRVGDAVFSSLFSYFFVFSCRFAITYEMLLDTFLCLLALKRHLFGYATPCNAKACFSQSEHFIQTRLFMTVYFDKIICFKFLYSGVWLG